MTFTAPPEAIPNNMHGKVTPDAPFIKISAT
jgi:hypothetical protein